MNKNKPKLALILCLLMLPIFLAPSLHLTQVAHATRIIEKQYFCDGIATVYGTITSGDHSSLHASDKLRAVIQATKSGATTSYLNYQPKGYYNLGGTTNDGAALTNIQTSDNSYVTLTSYATGTSSLPYNPNAYILKGSTGFVSGSVGNLTSDDSIYMTFSSYDTSTPQTTTYLTINYNFTSSLADWAINQGTLGTLGWHDSSVPQYGCARGSTTVGRNVAGAGDMSQSFTITSLPTAGETFLVQFRYRKFAAGIASVTHAMTVELIKPDNTVITIYSDTGTVGAGVTTPWTFVSSNRTGDITLTGTYTLKLKWSLKNGNDANAQTGGDYDDACVVKITAAKTQQTSEVEFTGSSNSYSWSQLVITIDSRWASASISVIIQVYNYGTSSYPTSGAGYLSYTSSATPDTDETKTLTITTSPWDFRDAYGNWKVKIKGVKDVGTQFNFRADLIEFKPTYYSEFTTDWYTVFTSVSLINVNKLNFTYEGRYSASSITQKLYVYDFSDSTWTLFNTSTISTVDEARNFQVTADLSKYVSDTGEVRIRVEGATSTTSGFSCKADYCHLQTQVDTSYYRTEWYATKMLDNVGVRNILTGMVVDVETQYGVASVQSIYLWDYSTNGWSLVDTYTFTAIFTDTARTVTITTNVRNYVSESGEMKVKVRYGDSTSQYNCLADFLDWKLRFTIYELNIRAVDQSGGPLGGATVEASGIGSNATNGQGWANFTVHGGNFDIRIVWQGSKVYESSITVSGDTLAECRCQVYITNLKFVDRKGYSINPDEVTLLCPNGTSVTLTKFSNIRLQNGTFTYTKIVWQGIEVEPLISSFDPSTEPAPTANLPVQFSGQPAGGVYDWSLIGAIIGVNAVIVLIQFSSLIGGRFRKFKK